ncbi:MAG: cell division protein FtsH, partial [Actinomycetota bacterium]|nr:cell division protein FtsH [Actinomycetota bacterium]
MGRFLRGGALYIVVLIIFVAVVFNLVSASSQNATELNSQEFQQAVEDGTLVSDLDENDRNRLLVRDRDQTVTGLLDDGSGGEGEPFEYPYPDYYDIAATFDEAGIPYYTDHQNQGLWFTLLTSFVPL